MVPKKSFFCFVFFLFLFIGNSVQSSIPKNTSSKEDIKQAVAILESLSEQDILHLEELIKQNGGVISEKDLAHSLSLGGVLGIVVPSVVVTFFGLICSLCVLGFCVYCKRKDIKRTYDLFCNESGGMDYEGYGCSEPRDELDEY